MDKVGEIISQIKRDEGYWGIADITQEQAKTLRNFSYAEYSEVVRRLLEEPVGDYSDKRGKEYRETYAHLVYGCFLFILRPKPELYKTLLIGTLGIADPTSIQYGVLALRLVKPVDEIANDLYIIAGEHQDNRELLQHIAWALYWLGFLIHGDNAAWVENHRVVSVHDNLASLHEESAKSDTDSEKANKMAGWAMEFVKKYYEDQRI